MSPLVEERLMGFPVLQVAIAAAAQPTNRATSAIPKFESWHPSSD
jgi:hypothetical protein